MTDDKGYISPSQLSTLARCGEAYRRRYIEGDRRPPGVAILRGKGVHAGAEVNFRQKIETHEDLRPEEIVEAAISSIEIAIAREGLELSEEEAGLSLRSVLGSLKDATARLALLHAIEQAPDYQPKLVEKGVRIVLPNSARDLFGYLDLLDDRGRVVDFKTAGRRKKQTDADVDLALTFYSAAARILEKIETPEVRLDVLVDNKKGPSRQIITSTRDRSDYEVLANRTTNALRVIESGCFTPALPGSWYCSARWCGYWSTCPYVNSERRDAAKKVGDQ